MEPVILTDYKIKLKLLFLHIDVCALEVILSPGYLYLGSSIITVISTFSSDCKGYGT